MKEELITYETAKLAKEEMFEFGDYTIDNHKITQALLQRWLREVHNIEVIVIPVRQRDSSEWYCYDSVLLLRETRKSLKKMFRKMCKGDGLNLYETYEEALEAGLKEALNLI